MLGALGALPGGKALTGGIQTLYQNQNPLVVAALQNRLLNPDLARAAFARAAKRGQNVNTNPLLRRLLPGAVAAVNNNALVSAGQN